MNLLDQYSQKAVKQEEDICCYCGKSETDKISIPQFMPVHPERCFDGDLCHGECEADLMERFFN